MGSRAEYSSEDDGLRGTAGAIRLAAERGLVADDFTILYGDSYLPIDLMPAWHAFLAGADPAMMTVMRNEGRWDSSNAIVADGRVVRYAKGDPDPRMHHIDYGLTMMRRTELEQRVGAGTVADLADVFEALAADGRLSAWEVHERFYEIGSLTGLADLDAALRAGGLGPPGKAWT